MIYDLHVHMAGLTPASIAGFHGTAARQGYMLRRFLRHLSLDGMGATAEGICRIRERFLFWVRESVVDRLVVLALDPVWNRGGAIDWDNTAFVVDNDEVAELAADHPKLLFGASVHPARPDAAVELERLIRRGACLVKWIPSAQHIEPDHPACFPFYEALAHHRIPLLVHTGNEHTVGRFSNSLNHPRRLKAALERGVTVIGAHCGARMFLHEKSCFEEWKSMALRYENFYGDLGAFGIPLRGGVLSTILKNRDLTAKILYGSDFPAFTWPVSHVFQLGLRRVLQLRRVTNPFDRACLTVKSHGVPDAVFAKAEELLRVPGEKKVGAMALDGQR